MPFQRHLYSCQLLNVNIHNHTFTNTKTPVDQTCVYTETPVFLSLLSTLCRQLYACPYPQKDTYRSDFCLHRDTCASDPCPIFYVHNADNTNSHLQIRLATSKSDSSNINTCILDLGLILNKCNGDQHKTLYQHTYTQISLFLVHHTHIPLPTNATPPADRLLLIHNTCISDICRTLNKHNQNNNTKTLTHIQTPGQLDYGQLWEGEAMKVTLCLPAAGSRRGSPPPVWGRTSQRGAWTIQCLAAARQG